MSITFYIAIEVDGGTRFAYSCDCSRRWCEACDEAWKTGADYPDQFTCADCTDVEVNMTESNTKDWLRWIGLPPDDCGQVSARELAARCRRRLWDETRNHDPAVEGYEAKDPGKARLIVCDRGPDYLRERTAQMLKVCEKAGDRLIAWA
ncbi:MAG TPA: hypothetical protein VLE97_11120 [Gaiellaceae bacterium]|nr:hypothetical protein [Gaiellaceae bacterium]